MGAQPGTQLALLVIQVVRRFGLPHAQAGKRLAGGRFGDVTGFDDGSFQRTAQGFV
ncbi:MAG: hypothetical protein VW877_16815 [Pseudomonadaceae bacterium]